jgi:S1-C subfamily serine protease
MAMAARAVSLLLVLCAAAVICHAEDPESLVVQMSPKEFGEGGDEEISSSEEGKEANVPVKDLGEADETGKPNLLQFANKLQAALKQMRSQRTNWPRNLEKIRNGVVQLRVVQEQFLWSMPYRTPLRETIFGSGWFIDNKEFGVNTNNDILIVTNAHVAKQAYSISIFIPELGQEPIAAKAVGICVQRDIALVKVVDPKAMMALYKARTGLTDIVKMKLGDSDKEVRGSPIMAVGYPLGMKSVKSSMGIVSGYQQFKNSLYLSITAPINPGNSGGPLYNSQGQVVGINSAKFAKASGISFAIPSNQVKVTLDSLYQTREFIEPELGIQMSVGTASLNEFLTGLKSKGGIYVKDVIPEGLYAAAGGAKGDLLLAIDGHKIDRFGKIWMPKLKDRFNMQGLLLRHPIGKNLNFHVYRAAKGGKGKGKLLKLSTLYRLTNRPAVHNLYEPVADRPRFVTFGGFVFMELNLNLVEANLDANPAELVKYMLPKNRDQRAVLITNIVPASLAAKDGSAKKGLLVQSVNGRKVKTMDQLCASLNANVDPKSFWNVQTAKTFTTFKVSDIMAYEKSVSGDAQHSSMYNGCKGKTVLEMLSR